MAGLASAAAAVAGVAVLCLGSGCANVEYVAQAVGGHLDLVQRARPVARWLDDPATPPALRGRLQLSQQMRDFAVQALKLPDNASYRSYADLGRSAAVWNVVAAPELSLTLKTWCYPLLGCVGYRGYFDRGGAEALGLALRGEGLEVGVYGVPAYSTLGWTRWLGGDPLLNTFIDRPDSDLARLIFHELAHQVVYAADDTTFNESFATAVERLGVQRWRAAQGLGPEDGTEARRRADFRTLTAQTRTALDTLYRSAASDVIKRQRKAALMTEMRAGYQALKDGTWSGFAGYDDWFARANNATLAVQAAYDSLVPGFERLFESEGQDFDRFYAAVRGLADLPRDERHARLRAVP
jgi:predicted aminopeptidase